MCKTQSSKNNVIIASAGSGKTTDIVKQALLLKDKKVLITTYTNENLAQINSYLVKINGFIPNNIKILSWYSFLLQDGVRPYQSLLTNHERINSIFFEAIPNICKFVKKSNLNKYYFTKGNYIYRDRVTDFVCLSDDKTKGLIIKRLECIYDYIFIDELQDFAGYDLTFLEKLFNSTISIIAVCDPRQATFTTNISSTKKQYKKYNISGWILKIQKCQMISVSTKNECHRCNQSICDFADSLFPQLPKTKSKNTKNTGHDGVFTISKKDVANYYKTHNPTVLRYNKSTDTLNYPAINIGLSKGRTYDRVLIFPTKPMIEYLNSKDISKAGDISKLYVAITRAKYSVAFVI